MRMRKLKWAVEYLKEAQILVQDPSQYKGRWKEFLSSESVCIEVGCGKGNYSLEMSQMYPEQGYVAIEKNESAAGIAAKKLDTNPHGKNLALIHGDGADLQEWFADHEVDVIHLNFSDPWPKKRYAKRRLSSPTFLNQYKDLLSEKGRVIMKTDNAELFAYSLIQFQDAGFRMEEVNLDFRKEEHKEDALTEYEAKFVEQGHPIYRCVWTVEKNEEETA